jgi:hypothetical protein
LKEKWKHDSFPSILILSIPSTCPNYYNRLIVFILVHHTYLSVTTLLTDFDEIANEILGEEI